MSTPGAQLSKVDSELVADWRLDRSRSANQLWILPTAEGADMFRKFGHAGFASLIAPWAAARNIETTSLRLVSHLPPTGDPLPSPPREPVVGAIVRDELSASVDLEVPYDLDIFAGHFSHVPIVPGAMLVGWAADIGAGLGIWHHGVTRAATMKFRRIVQPGPKYRLGLSWSANGDRLNFQFESAGVTHAAGALLAPKQ